MLLETGGEARFKVRPVEGIESTEVPPEEANQLILDGQQRLTSLTQVLTLDKPVLSNYPSVVRTLDEIRVYSSGASSSSSANPAATIAA